MEEQDSIDQSERCSRCVFLTPKLCSFPQVRADYEQSLIRPNSKAAKSSDNCLPQGDARLIQRFFCSLPIHRSSIFLEFRGASEGEIKTVGV